MDPAGNTDTATVTVTVTNDAPVATDDQDTTPDSTPVGVDILANDTDPNNDPLTISATTDPDNGAIQINDGGTPDDPTDDSIVYTPNPGFTGIDTFTYTIQDPAGNTDVATVTITVTNEAPIASNDTATTPTSTPVSIDVLDNDTDPNDDPLTVAVATDPDNGTVTVDDNGTPDDPTDDTISYTPDPGFSGTDTFTYTITDTAGNTDTATVTVVVTNEAPVAVDDSDTTADATPVDIDVLGNDSDPNNDPLTIMATTDPENGTIQVNTNGTPDDPTDDSIIYTPDPGFSGTDTFTYTIQDPAGNTDVATVTITVTNEAPVASNDTATAPTSTPISIDVLDNDTDPNDDPLTIAIATDPENGLVTVDDNGTPDDPTDDIITYTPDPGFSGTDTFTYTVTDPAGNTDTATVTVVITNDAPVAVDDQDTTPEATPVAIDVLSNDTDPNDDPLTITVITDPDSGVIQLNDSGTPDDPTDDTVTYTPNPGFSGVDSFTYTIQDPSGSTDVATVTVTVTNEAPEAGDDLVTTPTSTPVSIDVTTNDTDPNDDPLTVTISTDPENGTVTIDDNGTPDDPTDDTITYTPDAGFSGTDTFTYTITDPAGNTDTATVTVVVTNEAPVAVDDNETTAEATPVDIDVLDNDSDPNTDPLTITIATNPGNGTVQINNNDTPDDPTDDTVIYTPDPGFSGTDTFTYTITDPIGNTDTATVTVAVAQTPLAEDDLATTVPNVSVTLNVPGNDSDPDGDIDPTTVDLDPSTPGLQSTLTIPGQGVFTVDDTGLVTFTPAPNFTGVVSIPYTINDNDGLTSNIAQIVVTIGNQPVASDDSVTTALDTSVTINVTQNDLDPDGQIDITTVDLDPGSPGIQISFEVPGQGSFSVDETGLVTFTPIPGFSGTVTIPYVVNDDDGLTSEPALIEVTIGAGPIANDDNVAIPPNTPVTVPVVANDQDPDGAIDPTTVDLNPTTPEQETSLTIPGQGTFTVNDDGSVVFVPDAGFVGTVTVPYLVRDDEGLPSNEATITITIGGEDPVAADDLATGLPGFPVALNITDNDTDPDGEIDPTTVDLDPTTPELDSTFTVPGQGTFAVDDQGNVTFTPEPGFIGTVTLPYTVNDDDGFTSNQATITITIGLLERPPIAVSNTASTSPNTPVTFNITDNDRGEVDLSTVDLDPATPGQQSTVTIPGEGTFTVDESGNVTFTPDAGFTGESSINYTVDGDNGLTSNLAQITVTITAQPTPRPSLTPTPRPDGSGTVFFAKRITAINGRTLNRYRDVPGDVNDDAGVPWPGGATSFLRGGVDESVQPGDEVEFTLYFLVDGSVAGQAVAICDLIPAGTEFLAPLRVEIGGVSTVLSGSDDADAGAFIRPELIVPEVCGINTRSNLNGVIVVNVDELTPSTDGLAGAIKFRVRVLSSN